MNRFERLIANGRDLSDSTAQTLEKRLAREPDDLETRLLLIGYWGRLRLPLARDARDTLNGRRAEQRRHVCWLIDHHPGISLSDGWMGVPAVVDSEVAARWREAAGRDLDDADVAWNVAKASLFVDPDSALGLFERAKRGAPERARAILSLCFRHAGIGLPSSSAASDQRFASCGIANGLEAFDLAESDDARFLMLWDVRGCAKIIGNTELLAILRAADREGNLRREHAANPSDAKHHACTGRGLIALARGDLDAAESWLREAEEVGDLPHAPSPALVDALRDARAR